MGGIPNVSLGSDALAMPCIGMGTAAFPFVGSDEVRSAILHAMELGYRHFDTASLYQTEQVLGEAITRALSSGFIKSRDELFITSKLWCCDAHHDLVLPAIQKTLQKLGLDYLDLYLIHWPVRVQPGRYELPFPKEELLPMDMKSVWEAMEECQQIGLTRSIGVSNFSCKKLETLLSFASIPPVVNQVEVNPLWQQKKLREFCATKGIRMVAYSPLGARGTLWGSARVMECDVLKDIAEAKGKTLAQICLRWVYEQGDCVVVKSFNNKRLKENLDILDWELSEEERHKISQLPQQKGFPGIEFISGKWPCKTLNDLWDGEI